MNQRERLSRIMQFQTVDKVPNYEIGPWERTVERWHNEGLSSGGLEGILRGRRFYYSGRAGCHGVQFPMAFGAIGLTTLRIDGFGPLQAADRAGAVLTKPMAWMGGDLLLNVDPRRDITGMSDTICGMVSVEIRDEHNYPIEGYRFSDCNPLVRNTESFDENPDWSMPDRDTLGVKPVTWKGDRSARELAGKRIRLFFEIQDAQLYSYRAGTEGIEDIDPKMEWEKQRGGK